MTWPRNHLDAKLMKLYKLGLNWTITKNKFRTTSQSCLIEEQLQYFEANSILTQIKWLMIIDVTLLLYSEYRILRRIIRQLGTFHSGASLINKFLEILSRWFQSSGCSESAIRCASNNIFVRVHLLLQSSYTRVFLLKPFWCTELFIFQIWHYIHLHCKSQLNLRND